MHLRLKLRPHGMSRLACANASPSRFMHATPPSYASLALIDDEWVDLSNTRHLYESDPDAIPQSHLAFFFRKKLGIRGLSVEKAAHTLTPQQNHALFRGFKLPVMPEQPGPDECCGSGCAMCVNDMYSDAIIDYRKTVNRIREKLFEKEGKIDESDLPSQLRLSDLPDIDPSTKAFMQLQKSLKKKRKAQQESS